MFKRYSTDGTVTDCSFLCDSYAGTDPSAVWLVGGGPSLTPEIAGHIKRSRAPVCCVNTGGRAGDGEEPLVTPDFFVAWDTIGRFPRSTFISAGVIKFLPSWLKADLIAGGTEKACDCPSTYFVDVERRGYGDWLKPGSPNSNRTRDSFTMAIDILFRLGFRRIFCAGTDMIVRPSSEQIQIATSSCPKVGPENPGIEFQDGLLKHYTKTGPAKEFVWSDRLEDFRESCVRVGVAESPDAVCKVMDECPEREQQYRCGERKAFKAAVNTDSHYWTVTQMLRQSRRCLTLHGLQLVSCTEGSRLNDYFPYRDPEDVARELLSAVDPTNEKCVGRLTGNLDRPTIPFNRDVQPVDWDKTLEQRAKGDCGCGGKKKPAVEVDPQNERRAKVEARMQQIAAQKPVVVAEEG